MTRADLVQAIGAWLNSAEIEPSIPTLIRLAEAQIDRRLAQAGVSGALQRATTTVTSEYAAAPADLARPISVRASGGKTVQNVTAESLEALACANPPAAGAPTHFTVIGGDLRFYPAPKTPCTVELIYQAKLDPLSESNGTNWVLDSHPDVYLYGALLQSAPFLGEDHRLAAWSSLYNAALESMLEAQTDRRGAQGTPSFRANMPSRCDHA